MGEEEDLQSLLAEMDAEETREKREKFQEEQTRKIARFKLKKRFEKELGGKEGQAFAIFECIPGFCVFKKAEGVVFKKLKSGNVSEADADNFIQYHCVHPEKEVFVQWIDNWPGIVDEAFGACVRLYGANIENRAKK